MSSERVVPAGPVVGIIPARRSAIMRGGDPVARELTADATQDGDRYRESRHHMAPNPKARAMSDSIGRCHAAQKRIRQSAKLQLSPQRQPPRSGRQVLSLSAQIADDENVGVGDDRSSSDYGVRDPPDRRRQGTRARSPQQRLRRQRANRNSVSGPEPAPDHGTPYVCPAATPRPPILGRA